jgi:AcrR family transcriptional regulator
MTATTTPIGARERNRLRTRQRIVEAAVELHTVGPARTTVLGIAERAGVQRHTVYAHFPDETAIFRACTAHWFALNPVPDHERWAAIAPFDDRLEAAIDDVYAYWERTAGDLVAVMADVGRVAAMDEALAFWRERFETWVDAVIGDQRLRGARRTRLRAALRHAFAMETWRSLTAPGGLSRPEAVRLMADMVRLAGEPRRRAGRPTRS